MRLRGGNRHAQAARRERIRRTPLPRPSSSRARQPTVLGRIGHVDPAPEHRHPDPAGVEAADVGGAIDPPCQPRDHRPAGRGHRPPEAASQTKPVGGGPAGPDNGHPGTVGQHSSHIQQVGRIRQVGERAGKVLPENDRRPGCRAAVAGVDAEAVTDRPGHLDLTELDCPQHRPGVPHSASSLRIRSGCRPSEASRRRSKRRSQRRPVARASPTAASSTCSRRPGRQPSEPPAAPGPTPGPMSWNRSTAEARSRVASAVYGCRSRSPRLRRRLRPPPLDLDGPGRQ